MDSRRSFRSSLRSRDSSSVSDTDPREKIIDCCRKIVAFMCTQVGVGGLVVSYTLIGAVGFMHIEKRAENTEYLQVEKWRNNCAEELWAIAAEENIFNESSFKSSVDDALKRYQNNVVHSIKKGYDGRTPHEIWSYSAALMFSLSIITMIGYGNLVPRTPWGKGVTVIYAVFGIPLYVLYFMNMGKVLAGVFRCVYRWLYECSTERNADDPPKRIIVPSTACLWVIGAYVVTGSIMFAAWEKWNYLDSTYFCITSLCKIGFGDLVPGADISDSRGGNQTKLIINFIYMLVGLGLVAMCYNLMREKVQVKVQELKEDISQYVRLMNMSGGISPDTLAFRLRSVAGYDGRTNDIIYCPPSTPSSEQSTVVFFGGDVQDFPENMQSHRDHKHYIKWNLEDTGRLIQSQFQDCHVVVVRPYRIEYKTFSSFENFVPCNNCGVPEHTPMHFALQHLEKLLENVSERLRTATKNQLEQLVTNSPLGGLSNDGTQHELQFFRNSLPSSTSIEVSSLKNLNTDMLWWRENIELHKNNLILIGFSKGCVVLNQLLYEFHYLKTLTPDDNTSMSIVSRIKDMYWLDGGHSGGKNTWITSRSLLETLTRLGIRVHVRVTPYQINDERRPWIKKEEKMFTEMLQKLGANIERSVHFEGSFSTLYTHFDVLNVINRTN